MIEDDFEDARHLLRWALAVDRQSLSRGENLMGSQWRDEVVHLVGSNCPYCETKTEDGYACAECMTRMNLPTMDMKERTK